MRVSHIVIVALLVATMAEAQPTIRPGEYEVEYHMTLAGGDTDKAAMLNALGAAGMPNQKRRECITPDDIKDKDFSKLIAAEAAESNCTLSDTKSTGNKLKFAMTCEEDGERTTTALEMTFGPDAFSGVATAKGSDGLVIDMKINAKRIGECRK